MDMSENKLIRFLWTTILLVSLCALARFHANYFMGCLLCGVALVVVFQIQSISDEQSRSSLAIQGILSLLFSLTAGHFMAYLIFFELRFEERDKRGLRGILPGGFCFFLSLGAGLKRGEEMSSLLPSVLWHTLVLTVCAGVFLLVETGMTHYLRGQRESALAVQGAAINELYEKKLNQELRVKNFLAERNARMEERENISRNIHNSVGHTITAAVMTLDAAELLVDVDTGKAKERMMTARERMKEGLSAIRLAVRVLDKENQGVQIEDFLRELSAVTENFMMDTELAVKTDADIAPNLPEIPKEHTEFLTGAVQELLTNGVKHGNATRFLLSVRADSGHLQVSVKDNGTGDFSEVNKDAKIAAGFGLKKIVSYLKKCGGNAGFTNENGFCAVLTVPLYREETDGDV